MNDSTEDPKRKAILARIRAMMARTVANGCTEAEAEAAATLVDKLVAEYEIDLTETLVGDQEIVRLEIALNKHPVRYAALKIGAFCDCKVWYDDNHGAQNLCFLGLEIDTEIAEYLLLLFQRAIDREVLQYSAFNPEMALEDPTNAKGMVQSFSVGMASRLGDRLADLKGKRDFAQRSRGFDLVLAKKPLIDEAFASLGFELGRDDRHKMSVRHDAAYRAGRTAADKVSINQGVAGRANNGRIK